MNPYFTWAIARLKEPSTYAGAGAICASLASQLPWPKLDGALAVAAMIFGAVAIAVKEAEKPSTPGDTNASSPPTA